jgi:hypothetical protein
MTTELSTRDQIEAVTAAEELIERITVAGNRQDGAARTGSSRTTPR